MNNMRKHRYRKPVERAHAWQTRCYSFYHRRISGTRILSGPVHIDESGADIIEIGVPSRTPWRTARLLNRHPGDALTRGVSLNGF